MLNIKNITVLVILCFLISGCDFLGLKKQDTDQNQEQNSEVELQLQEQETEPELPQVDFENTIFFSQHKEGTNDIYPVQVMNLDGKNHLQLFANSEFLETKGKIEFTADNKFLYPKLKQGIVKIMYFDPKKNEKIEFINGTEYEEYHKNQPKVSADGQIVAFVLTDKENNRHIAFADLSGEIIREFKHNPVGTLQAKDPALSYDSQSLLFTGVISEEKSNIYSRLVSKPTEIYQYTNDNFLNFNPIYTKDHSKIIFVSDRTGKQNIFMMDNYGLLEEQVEQGAAIPAQESIEQLTFLGENKSPILSPDGTEILFTSNRDGDWEIYKMKIDGTNQIQLTENEVDDVSPNYYQNYLQVAPLPEPTEEKATSATEIDTSDPKTIVDEFCLSKDQKLRLQLIDAKDWFDLPEGYEYSQVRDPYYFIENHAMVSAEYMNETEEILVVNYILQKQGLDDWIIISRYKDQEDITVGDAGKYLDFETIQKAVDAGNDAWRLESFMMVKEDALQFGFSEDDSFIQKNPDEDFIKIAHKGNIYIVYVYQPVKSGADGIWAIQRIERQ